MNAFAGPERKTSAQHPHGLVGFADQMHLDAMAFAVEDRAVGKRRKVEIAGELAVDAGQQVEIETRGDAGGIVVGGVERPFVLFEIDTDQHLRTAPQNTAGAAQEAAGLTRFEIAERRAWKK